MADEKKDDLAYGMEGQEYLQQTPEMVVEDLVDSSVAYRGEPFDSIVEGWEFPLKVLVHRRRVVDAAYVDIIASDAVEGALERLDEEYGNWDESATATEDMKTAARAFALMVIADYNVWQCEDTGEVIEFTREEVEALTEPGEKS